jgi:hypothetical protein
MAAGPGTRAGHAMAYHAGFGAVCLLGGDREAMGSPTEQPWFWDGRQWATRGTAATPPARTLPAAAGDPERRSVLLFGGGAILAPGKYGDALNDLWELRADGTWMHHETPGPQPEPRDHHAAAFDAARGRLVVYGGTEADEWHTDVWEWDRARWHRIQAPAGPGERVHHAMAYDERRRRIVLRGGFGSNRARPHDTWEWDGTRWQMTVADGPGAEDRHRMAYDAAREVTVLFGGETCVYDGTAWRRVTPAPSPAARSVHALAYDPPRKRVVLYGGSVGSRNSDETWEWDGAAWRPTA